MVEPEIKIGYVSGYLNSKNHELSLKTVVTGVASLSRTKD